MRQTTRKHLIQALRGLDTGLMARGICRQTHVAFKGRTDYPEAYEWMSEAFKRWPLYSYSGDPTFPVPHPTVRSPENAYYSNLLWVGEYGQNRRDLVAFLIEEATNG